MSLQNGSGRPPLWSGGDRVAQDGPGGLRGVAPAAARGAESLGERRVPGAEKDLVQEMVCPGVKKERIIPKTDYW